MQNRRHFWTVAVKWALLFFALYLIPIFVFFKRIADVSVPRSSPYELPLYKCPKRILLNTSGNVFRKTSPTSEQNVPYKRILVVTNYSNPNKLLANYLKYLKIPIRYIQSAQISQLTLEIDGRGRFSAFVFENYNHFHALPDDEKKKWSEYCRKYGIGIISFMVKDDANVKEFSHFSSYSIGDVKSIKFVKSPVNYVAKSSSEFIFTTNTSIWTTFSAKSDAIKKILEVSDAASNTFPVVVLDTDEAQPSHIIFGHALNHWTLKLALFDALIYVSRVIKPDLERFIQIDIDDVFLGQRGTKLSPPDVDALLETQLDLRQYIDGFTFLLGFSGYFFRNGDKLDAAGDEALVARAREFLWFPHMWRHNHPQEFIGDYLQAVMAQNRMFATEMGLNMSAGYAISPQHGGVYPIYQPLYDAWRTVWNVSVTATEEYPHFRPAAGRRAFVHGDVTVLPRQVCGLFTHTLFVHAYPDGIDSLYANIFGGELFETVLMNKFSIFMTHQQNYANDRLGSFTFRNLVRFLDCWTNLHLKWVPPVELVRRYFAEFPQERRLIHTNPCSDARHRVMLPVNSVLCRNLILPSLVILGPQKTGTSALSVFLSLHPDVSTNRHIPKYFEELQFFNSANYEEGVAWYADKFPAVFANNSATDGGRLMVFEKSANYFDSTDAPLRMHALLPDANLVVILMDPVDRAYSWYQHMRNHNDTAARLFTAEQVFIHGEPSAERLRQRCLTPGLYAAHLDRWLDHYSAGQLLVIDGERLRRQPSSLMADLVERLGLATWAVNYEKRLRFVGQKGFFCPILTDGQVRCLGQTKGRKYSPMSAELRRHLSAFYKPHNRALKWLLTSHNYSLPNFLL